MLLRARSLGGGEEGERGRRRCGQVREIAARRGGGRRLHGKAAWDGSCGGEGGRGRHRSRGDHGTATEVFPSASQSAQTSAGEGVPGEAISVRGSSGLGRSRERSHSG